MILKRATDVATSAGQWKSALNINDLLALPYKRK